MKIIWTCKVLILFRILNEGSKYIIDDCVSVSIICVWKYLFLVIYAEISVYWDKKWFFVTKSNFLTLISLQPYGLNHWYFKLRFFNLTEYLVWNLLDLRHLVALITRLENHEFVAKTQFIWFNLNPKKILRILSLKRFKYN